MTDFRRLSARHQAWESNRAKLTPLCTCTFPTATLCWQYENDAFGELDSVDSCECPCHINVAKDSDHLIACEDLVQKSGRII